MKRLEVNILKYVWLFDGKMEFVPGKILKFIFKIKKRIFISDFLSIG